MTAVELSQAEADVLLAMEKRRADKHQRIYPAPGSRLTIPLISRDRHESFLLDVRRARINLANGTYQTRSRQVVILARLDFGGAPHRNPDGEEVGSPHLHVYREGFADKWAFPLSHEQFPKPDNLWHTFEDFMRYCNIASPHDIQKGLFS